MAGSRTSPHHSAAKAFAQRTRERYGDAVEGILLYGSVARSEERGVNSDVDLLVILRDPVDKPEVEEQIRDLAYDIELDRGLVMSLVVKAASEYDEEKNRPFFQNIRQDAEVLYG